MLSAAPQTVAPQAWFELASRREIRTRQMPDAPVDAGYDRAFHIEEERLSPGTTLLVVHGEADLHSAPELRSRLRATIDGGAGQVVVDLSDTTFVDSTSLGVLLGAMKRLRKDHGQIRLVASRPEIRRIFEITLLDNVLPLHESRAEALEAFSGGAG